MDSRSRTFLVVAIAALVVGGVVGPGVLADSNDYEITVEGSLSIPEQKVNPEEVPGKFTVSSVKVVNPGEEFTAEIDAPSGESYRVQLRNPDGTNLDTSLGKTGDSTIKVATGSSSDNPYRLDGDLSPGMYFIAIYGDDGNYKDIHPVLIEEYDVAVEWENVPTEGQSGAEISVTANVTRIAYGGQSISYVDIVVTDGENFHNQSISLTPDYTSQYRVYSGSVTLDSDSLPPGDDYSVYVVARGSEKIKDLAVPVGVSERRAFSITEQPTATPTPVPTPTPTPTPTPPPETPTPTPTPTPPPETPTPTPPPETPTPTPTPTPPPETPTPTPPPETPTPTLTPTPPPETPTPTPTPPPKTPTPTPTPDPPTPTPTPPPETPTPTPTPPPETPTATPTPPPETPTPTPTPTPPPETPTPTPTPTPPPPTSAPTPTATPDTPTATPQPPTPEPGTPAGTPPPLEVPGSTIVNTPTTTPTPTDDAVVTPAELGPTGTDEATEGAVTPGQPGFTLAGTLLVLAVLAAVARRRRE